ncbi:type I DNA topoisomerase, partial [bacterium]|nr:type I DNA topoisomerase [bacterium]
MENGLIIVESPTKAKTIRGILGKDYTVFATMGHIRDLPENEFGVEIEKNFLPKYVIIPGKEKLVEKLKKIAEKYKNIYMATDEDREGEAIAWHTTLAIGKKIEEVKRVAFHEIIPEAVREAFNNPRQISLNLVNAQQARRILDRIVGYTLSPFLGRFIEKGLSAGRVQSITLRLIVERENEIENFIPVTYWIVKAIGIKEGKKITFILTKIGDKKLEKEDIKDEKQCEEILENLRKGKLIVKEIKRIPKKISPPPPFITSTLQQEASTKLGFSSSKTMFIAQQLYEGVEIEGKNIGLITYMRTDSPSVAKQAQYQALKYIKENIGEEFVPSKPNIYRSKSATAQEAHEAIRPTYVFRTPESIKKYLNVSQYRLYNLIWKRFVASQMKWAEVESIKVIAQNQEYQFEAEANIIKFEGFMRIWPIRIDKGQQLFDIKENEEIQVEKYIKEKHQTKPPPRYTEATLIKTLEKYGIGRPSTYAPTISILKNRGYVKVEKRYFIPSNLGKGVNQLLTKFFPEIIKIDFTAEMEQSLDKIANGEKEWIEVLKEFYKIYKPMLDKAYREVENDNKIVQNVFIKGKNCPVCGKELVLKKGKYGVFLACSGYPECRYT